MTEKTLNVLPLDASRVRAESHAWLVHNVTVPKGTPMEHLLVPSFWRRCGGRFHRHDRLEVTTDDGEYFAELMVLAVDDGKGVIMQALRGVALFEVAGLFDNVAHPNKEGLQGRYGGPQMKWCVGNAKGEVLVEGLPDAASVRGWIENKMRSHSTGDAA